MSILATSTTSTRHFDMGIAEALGDVNAAIIVQQLNYWMEKEGVGVIIKGVKYVYNTFVDWVNSQFKWLSVWQFRKAMNLLRSLDIVKVIRYKSREWNQTNYYTLDRDRLNDYLNNQIAQSIEISEMWSNTDRDEGYQTFDLRSSDISLNESKITTKDRTTKQLGDPANQNSSFAAASPKMAQKEEKSQSSRNHHSARLVASNSQIKQESTQDKSNPNEERKVAQVDYIVNKDWSKLIPLLDSTGIPINKTLKDLLKLYPPQKVESAIALLRARKRERQIPNPSGYFVSALKGDWGAKNLVSEEGSDKPGGMASLRTEEIDKGAVFCHWYDLARELGYCSGQEIRSGEQWICLSGSWEKWDKAVERGYSLDYLQKIMKRNNK